MSMVIDGSQFAKGAKKPLNLQNISQKGIVDRLNHVSNKVKTPELVDIHHNSVIVNNKNVSFGNSLVHVSSNLGKRACAGINLLNGNEVLLIGKNFNNVMNLLKDSVDKFPNVIKKLLFVGDSKLESTFAVYIDEMGHKRILNIGKDRFLITKTLHSDGYSILPGQAAYLDESDKIFANGMNFDIRLNLGDEADKYMTMVRRYNLSKYDKGEISRLNLKRLKKLTEATNKTNVKKWPMFSDVGGQDKAIEQIKTEIIRPLKYPQLFRGIKKINSAMFIGPPGTGKTLTAMAIENEAGIPIYKLNGSLLEDMYIGNSAKNINNYYDNAIKNQPCMIIYDEADNIFRKRGGHNSHHDESLNMHLDKISQIEKGGHQVFLVAITNRPDVFDPAVLRNGRFGSKVEFDLPDLQGCKDIFQKGSKDINLIDVNVDKIVKKIHDEKFSGASISGLLSDAQLYSLERQGILQKMDEGTFVDTPDFIIDVTTEDINKAVQKQLNERKLLKKYADENSSSTVKEMKDQIIAREKAQNEINAEKPKRKLVGYLAQQ